MESVMHENGKQMFLKYGLPHIGATDNVLELGPSRRRSDLMDSLPDGTTYNYADIRNFQLGPGFVRMLNPYSIDAPDNSFDTVFAAQVIEHVVKPWLWVPELARVSRRLVILVAPTDYEYPCPPDHWRLFSDEMRVLLDTAGLKTITAIHESIDGQHTDCIGIGAITC
jgi:hypothetical protein